MSDLHPDPGAAEPAEADLDAALAECELEFRDELVTMFRQPDDLVGRTHHDVEATLLERSTLGAAADLAGTGWRVLRLLFTPAPRTGATTSEHRQ